MYSLIKYTVYVQCNVDVFYSKFEDNFYKNLNVNVLLLSLLNKTTMFSSKKDKTVFSCIFNNKIGDHGIFLQIKNLKL